MHKRRREAREERVSCRSPSDPVEIPPLVVRCEGVERVGDPHLMAVERERLGVDVVGEHGLPRRCGHGLGTQLHAGRRRRRNAAEPEDDEAGEKRRQRRGERARRA